MRRALAILLMLALLLSASAAFASSIGLEDILSQSDVSNVPDLSSFAALQASVPDKDGRVTVTLSKPVDRIWANWMGDNEKPEELFLTDKLTATFSTKGHPYQVGATPPASQDLFKEETSKRYVIEFGAEESQVNWRTIQANNAALHGHCVEVVRPHWILIRTADDTVVDSYSDKKVSGDITVPDGYKIQKVEGYAVAWQYGSNGSDGSPNLAYITVQNGYVVIYARNGKIQYVTEYTPGMKVFGIDVEPTNLEKGLVLSAYYVPGRINEYQDLPELPPLYSFAGITPGPGPGKDGSITLNLTKPVDHFWVNWKGAGEPEELSYSQTLKIVISAQDRQSQDNISPDSTDSKETKYYTYRQPIVWGAYDSHVNWAVNQAKQKVGPNAEVKVVMPHWELEEISTGKVVREFDDSVLCTEINVPNGYRLLKKNGYAEAYSAAAAGSGGTSNVAYITEQNGWTVNYTSGGKIVGISTEVPESDYFNTGMKGTAIVQFNLSEYGQWYVSQVTETYPDGSSITAVYSRYGNGKLDKYTVSQ